MNVAAPHPLTFSLWLLLKPVVKVVLVIGKLNSVPDAVVGARCKAGPWQLLCFCSLCVDTRALLTVSVWVYAGVGKTSC